jgi:hypothetical protein
MICAWTSSKHFSLTPPFKGSFSVQERAGHAAKLEYLERCQLAREEPDPVMLDRVYWKAFNAAAPKRPLVL